MFRLLLIVLLGAGAWMYFTESGQMFFKDNFTAASPPVAVDQRALQRVQRELLDAQGKLNAARAELARREADDRMAAQQGKRLLFHTDKELLKRSIQRWQDEESRLARELQIVQAGRPATVAR